jgi:hypothetical protein
MKPVCGNCGRLDLECEQSEDATWIITNTDPSPDQFEQNAPLLIDVFRSRMSDLDHILEDPIVHTPVNLITPPATTDSGVPHRKVHLNCESAYLLQTYVRTVATWMDIFDHSSTYQHKIPQLVMASPLLFHCVCAFTANHLALCTANRNPSWKLTAVRHYGEALRLLIDALGTPSHEHALTASMLLLSYEIQEALRSEDYRRHFLGLTMLIKNRGSTAQSKGIECANFWVYIRHEIVVAMANEQPLILDPKHWAVSWQEGETREDMLGNHVLWILARVLNLIFGPDGRSDSGKIQREEFLREIEVWRAGLSDTFVGIGYGDEDDDGFRKVYFPVVAAAAAAFCKSYCTSINQANLHILIYYTSRVSHRSYTPLCRAGFAR